MAGLEEEARVLAIVFSAVSLQFAQVNLNSPQELQFTSRYFKLIVQHQFIFGSFLIRLSLRASLVLVRDLCGHLAECGLDCYTTCFS